MVGGNLTSVVTLRLHSHSALLTLSLTQIKKKKNTLHVALPAV